MNKHIITFAAALAMVFVGAGCDYNEDNFEGLQDGTVATDVKTLEYTLTEADYTTLVGLSANKTLAGDTDKTALANVGKNFYFTPTISAEKYVPAFLANAYPTADNTSSVKVTYNYKSGEVAATVVEVESAAIVKLAAADYQEVWGEGSDYNFFTPEETAAKHLPAILAASQSGVTAGDMVWVDYNVADTEPLLSETAFEETFDSWTDTWANVITNDNATSATWAAKSYSGNNYVQCSANGKAGVNEIYLVSPAIDITKDMTFTFDACYGYYKTEGGRVSVLISSDLAAGAITKETIKAATWTDITSSVSIPIPTANYGTLGNVCTYNMDSFAGKSVRIAFRYDGNGDTSATTTVQIDNPLIMKGVKTPYSTSSLLYKYNGTAWAAYAPASVRQLVKADCAAMGSKYDSFDTSFNADNYVPALLKAEHAYAQVDDVMYVAYKYYDSSSKVTSVRGDEYTYDGSQWVKNNGVTEETAQFIRSNAKWVWDPSVTIILTPGKGIELSALYYQACVDWVFENIDKPLGSTDIKSGKFYVTSYGNNDYYSGASAFQNNIDWRVSAAREQYAEAYPSSMTDDQVLEALKQHTIEVFAGVLSVLHADAKAVAGVDVTYTIQVGIYTGTSISAPTHKLVYKVVSDGKFEFVSFSAL